MDERNGRDRRPRQPGNIDDEVSFHLEMRARELMEQGLTETEARHEARQRFGFLLGTVVSVSDYPVTIQAAAHQIGDLETARTLLGGETRIEVLANLERDEARSLVWTSGKGPGDFPVTAGTTAEVRVTVEEIAPIELVLPFLKSLVGTQ